MMARILRAPLDDYLAALAACLPRLGLRPVLTIIAAATACWWVYVPVHELAHALGCWLAGGSVTRLEIDPLYGAAWLHRFFPFVAVGSAYAGQLTGFDTHGSDLTYLATDFLPFTLTIALGVPLLRAAARARAPGRACLLLGAALPIAYAPFIAVTGDYYEMGSIVASRLAAWYTPGFGVARWRGDDLLALAARLWRTDGRAADAAGLLAGLLIGVVLLYATYWAGRLWSGLLCRDEPDIASQKFVDADGSLQ